MTRHALAAAWLIVLTSLLAIQSAHAQNALGLTASPGTISFTANVPGSTVVGSSNASVSFSMNTHNNLTWTMKVGTASTTFSGCSTVPTSAVTVKCLSATVSGNARGATAGCSATSFTALPGSLPGLQVATGLEPSSGTGIPFTVVLSYQLADSWRYVAQTCPLTLTYTVTAP